MNEDVDPVVARQRALASAHLRNWREVPAVLLDRHLEVLASNPLARALSASFERGVNLARFTFLEPTVERSGASFTAAATQIAGMLNDSLALHEGDSEFREIVGELSAKSHTFSEVWAKESIGAQVTGNVGFTDTRVGTLSLGYSLVRIPEDPDDYLLVFCTTADGAQSQLDALIALIADDPLSLTEG
ncbi:hypothetical protein [Salinibacterium sp. SWN248]|uniref:MmyB family transcriptional regulator n=1 Tax=Salinibacterium sp. SWN248 TaxID=2792056 RepID=UPI0018CDCE0A|nr:hypothetical protein [Salinibacterium sp. SWN248]MBH0023655.1 hypothetical protein [Salinibacterium sp. SWN248]